MLAYMLKKGRVLFAVLALGFGTASAEARWRTEPPATDAVTADRVEKGDSDVGLAALALGLAIFVFLAWAAVRTSGGSVPAHDLPE